MALYIRSLSFQCALSRACFSSPSSFINLSVITYQYQLISYLINHKYSYVVYTRTLNYFVPIHRIYVRVVSTSTMPVIVLVKS